MTSGQGVLAGTDAQSTSSACMVAKQVMHLAWGMQFRNAESHRSCSSPPAWRRRRCCLVGSSAVRFDGRKVSRPPSLCGGEILSRAAILRRRGEWKEGTCVSKRFMHARFVLIKSRRLERAALVSRCTSYRCGRYHPTLTSLRLGWSPIGHRRRPGWPVAVGAPSRTSSSWRHEVREK